MDIFGTIALLLIAWKSRLLLFYMVSLSLIRLIVFGISLQGGYGMFIMKHIQLLAGNLYSSYGINIPVEVRNIKDLKREDSGVYDIGDKVNDTHIVYIKLNERNPLRWIWSLYRDAYILYSLVDDINKTKKQNPYIFDNANDYKLGFKEILKILFLGKL